MTGSRPRLVWSRACTKPQRNRCAVITHHTRAATGRGHGGLHTPAMTEAVIMPHSAPSADTSAVSAAMITAMSASS